MTKRCNVDLLCIGSEPAGIAAALVAAAAGRSVLLVDPAPAEGGPPRRPIATRHLKAALSSLRTGSERPILESWLRGAEAAARREASRFRRELARLGVEQVWGAGSFTSESSVALRSPRGTRTVDADRILISCSTIPGPATLQSDDDVPTTLEEIPALGDLPQTLTIVGGGPSGIEHASIFAELGVSVTLIDRRLRSLDAIDTEVADRLLHQLRNRGVSIRFGDGAESITTVESPRRGVVTRLESGRVLVADAVLQTSGRVLATGSLALEKARIATGRHGRLHVDSEFCTSNPHVYAAGESTGRPTITSGHAEEGRVAVRHALGLAGTSTTVAAPSELATSPGLGAIGRTEQELTAERVPFESGTATHDAIFVKLLAHAETRALLGVHALGPGATDLIHVGQAVLAHGGSIDYFVDTAFVQGSAVETHRDAALDLIEKLACAAATAATTPATARVVTTTSTKATTIV